MIKHFVALKFNKEILTEDNMDLFRSLYKKMEKEIKGMSDSKVEENVVDRDENFDLIIEFKLEKKEDLNEYLAHKLHLEFVGHVKEHVENKMTIDTVI